LSDYTVVKQYPEKLFNEAGGKQVHQKSQDILTGLTWAFDEKNVGWPISV